MMAPHEASRRTPFTLNGTVVFAHESSCAEKFRVQGCALGLHGCQLSAWNVELAVLTLTAGWHCSVYRGGDP